MGYLSLIFSELLLGILVFTVEIKVFTPLYPLILCPQPETLFHKPRPSEPGSLRSYTMSWVAVKELFVFHGYTQLEIRNHRFYCMPGVGYLKVLNQVKLLGFRISGFGFRGEGLGFRVLGSSLWGVGFGAEDFT